MFSVCSLVEGEIERRIGNIKFRVPIPHLGGFDPEELSVEFDARWNIFHVDRRVGLPYSDRFRSHLVLPQRKIYIRLCECKDRKRPCSYLSSHISFWIMPGKKKPLALELLFRALADPTRLRLLNLIAGSEICVCFFVEILGISQPKISRHLAYLRRAGIVAARRQGRWMHYRLLAPQDPAVSSILKETLTHLRERPDMRRELAKLDSACCKPGKFELPDKAPQPSIVSIAPR
jgi:ArsR family transcriptional regulator